MTYLGIGILPFEKGASMFRNVLATLGIRSQRPGPDKPPHAQARAGSSPKPPGRIPDPNVGGISSFSLGTLMHRFEIVRLDESTAAVNCWRLVAADTGQELSCRTRLDKLCDDVLCEELKRLFGSELNGLAYLNVVDQNGTVSPGDKIQLVMDRYPPGKGSPQVKSRPYAHLMSVGIDPVNYAKIVSQSPKVPHSWNRPVTNVPVKFSDKFLQQNALTVVCEVVDAPQPAIPSASAFPINFLRRNGRDDRLNSMKEAAIFLQILAAIQNKPELSGARELFLRRSDCSPFERMTQLFYYLHVAGYQRIRYCSRAFSGISRR